MHAQAVAKESLILTSAQRRKLARLTRLAGQREACAFLMGDTVEGRHVIRSVVAARNTHRSRHSFGIDIRALHQLPAPPIGLFHSHSAGTKPSWEDLKIFDRFPGLGCQLIGARGAGGMTWRAFTAANDDLPIMTT